MRAPDGKPVKINLPFHIENYNSNRDTSKFTVDYLCYCNSQKTLPILPVRLQARTYYGRADKLVVLALGKSKSISQPIAYPRRLGDF